MCLTLGPWLRSASVSCRLPKRSLFAGQPALSLRGNCSARPRSQVWSSRVNGETESSRNQGAFLSRAHTSQRPANDQTRAGRNLLTGLRDGVLVTGQGGGHSSPGCWHRKESRPGGLSPSSCFNPRAGFSILVMTGQSR